MKETPEEKEERLAEAKAAKELARTENAEVTASKEQELKAKQVWETVLTDNPFERPLQVLISETKTNRSDVLWVKYSRYQPNVGNTPFEYAAENDFRKMYPRYVSPVV